MMTHPVQNLNELLTNPDHYGNGQDIPWSDPDFSRRILKEQLNPDNDIAGRRASAIEKFVRFIHVQLLNGQKSRILDMGCGPGLYAHRLARYGHRCTGIDISPAAIEYAEKTAKDQQLSCTFIKGDLHTVDAGKNFRLASLSFGDFNTFPRKTARDLVRKLSSTLQPDGLLLLEVLTEQGIQNIAERDASWSVRDGELFTDQPYLFLDRYRFNHKNHSAEADYFVIDSAGTINHYSQHYTQYSDDEYQHLLLDSGFDSVEYYAGFGPGSHDFSDDLQIIVGRK